METLPLLLGHRGARAEKAIPENTLASFDLALAEGCDGFEFDVRLSADEQAVICHDAASHGCEIAACSAEQLGLPHLSEVLFRYQARAFLDIELKVPGVEAITAAQLRKIKPNRGFVISSFLPGVLEAMHALDEAFPLGLICETHAQLARWTDLPISHVIPQHQLVREDLVSQIKHAEKKIFVWTVNSVDDAKRFCDWGADGIISDLPGTLRTHAAMKQEKS